MGDIIVIIGLGEFNIFDILCDINNVEVLFVLIVDELMVMMFFCVNILLFCG